MEGKIYMSWDEAFADRFTVAFTPAIALERRFDAALLRRVRGAKCGVRVSRLL